MDSLEYNIFSISLNSENRLIIELALLPILLLSIILIVFFLWKVFYSNKLSKHFEIVSVDIELGNVGKVSFKPNSEDIQIAHRVWTELVTRKAALPLDIENDVIVEIYNSWYALFGKVRELIEAIPGQRLRNEESTRKIVQIIIDSLNIGLRPHLTKWQARYRNWYSTNESRLCEMSPQELQKEFPEYDLLIAEMQIVNQKMIQYSEELKKIVLGK